MISGISMMWLRVMMFGIFMKVFFGIWFDFKFGFWEVELVDIFI